ncbi:ribosomal RNA small subunit methyltransferase A [Ilumatobacter nonamiensis]|uniref:ribosomal RNA small subunit methyltransferase A n=1 Tax=Ilumatobacter nonamiensis TaxID=467093 RepID=UPI00034AE0AC|nr:rRNA adenine N(6)-methyltransferase family protein [Ilumatobacter nonamiensis]
MSARRPTERDRRRRELGQNFLADRRLVEQFVDGLDLHPGELVVDLGAGSGALTRSLLAAGVRVWAVEVDPTWVDRLRSGVGAESADVRVIAADLRTVRMPREPYRVVANPPFALATATLAKLLDRPERGPERADLILQKEVAIKLARQPPASLRTAAWAPWWEFRLGRTIGRNAFRPRPSVDAAVVTVVRRDPSVFPTWLGPRLRELLRPAWTNQQPNA